MNHTIRNALLLVLGTIPIIFLAVFLFTRPAIFAEFDLSDKGEIGDVINGISAPIIGLLGALLIYMSFYQQLEANKIQRAAIAAESRRAQDAKEFSTLLDLYRSIKEDFESLEFASNFSRETNPPTGRTSGR